MDDISFTPKSTTRAFIAIKGSRNVWTQEIKPNFQMFVVEAVIASAFAVSPLSFLSVVCRFNTELVALSIDGTHVTSATKGFRNDKIFQDWMEIYSTVLEAKGIEKPVI